MGIAACAATTHLPKKLAGLPPDNPYLATRISKLTKIPFGANEPLLQRALEAGGIGLWEYMAATSLIDLYHNVLAFETLSPGRYYGPVADFVKFVVDEDKPTVLDMLAQCNLGTKQVTAEFRIRTTNTKIVWLACCGELMHLEDGRSRYVGTITDVTDINERELKLQAYHEALFSLARNPLVVDRTDFLTAAAHILKQSASELNVGRASLWQFKTEPHAALECKHLFDARNNRAATEAMALLQSDFPVYFEAISHRRTLAVGDALLDPVLREFVPSYLPSTGVRALLDVPLFYRGQLWGVICYEDCVGPRNWDADAQSFASSAADLVALALEASIRAIHEHELSITRERHRAFVQTALDPIWCVDINPPVSVTLAPSEQVALLRQNARITDANSAFARDYGLEPTAISGTSLSQTMPELFKGSSLPDWIDRGYQLIDRELTQRGRGEEQAQWLSLTLLGVVEDGHLVRFWGARRNITDRKRYQSLLEHLAFRDPLTGLLNRQRMVAEVTDVLTRRTGNGTDTPCTLLLMDLNQFKDINDTLGHSAGDEVLRQMRNRLESVLTDVDALSARLGGDEFGIFARHIGSADEAMRLGESITAALSEPFELHGSRFHVSASIGAAIFPTHGRTFSDLSRSADEAMYAAKQTGGGTRLFSRSTVVFEQKKLGLLARLPEAISAGELILEFQPIINCATGKTSRMEALVRWQHPEHGRLEAKDFVHKAEMSDSIRILTRWVIDQALRSAREWQHYAPGVGVSVNISPRLLGDSGIVTHLRDTVADCGLPARLVDLEITETSLIHNQERAALVLADCRAAGFSIVIDDYGVGFCSLAYLRRLPLRGLKIDQSFVSKMTRNAEDAIIVQSTIALAHNLGLTVVAEGVEDHATLSQLQSYGCDFAQGYSIAMPLPKSEVSVWLRSHQVPPPDRLRAVR
ncbi:MAG: EAL domain-containing protein [Betaproteobacteria bacterium]|nr:MAG: EAL domain-containing protein [Betaproteobacteria bacterium]